MPLVEVYTDDEGRESYRVTDDGVRVGRMLAMGDEADAEDVLSAMLERRES